MKKKTVLLGLLGPTLDLGSKGGRWRKWRPSVAACAQYDLPIDRFELIYQSQFERLCKQVTGDIHEISPETEVNRRVLEIRDPWNFEEVFSVFHDFADKYPFDPEKEDYLIHISTGTHVAQICLFLLAETKYFPGRLLQTGMDRRAKLEERYLGTYRIIDLDLSTYDPIAARFQRVQLESRDFLKAGIQTANVRFNALIDRVEKVAVRSEEPILLMGPTGAGKTELARRIFQLKQQRRQFKGTFVELNCATLRGDSAMSTLFGHKKGAFTGATSDRRGLLKEADGGLLFLDEIGELGLDEQAMLLRALEEKKFLPMGSDKEVSSDFQLIAGTNRNLALRVSEGGFREDLLARINLWSFQLPGLSERREDIEPNLEYELLKFAKKTGKKITFTREAKERFLKFSRQASSTWRGNFRELNAAVVRMGTFADAGRIGLKLVDEEAAHLQSAWAQSGGGGFPQCESVLGLEKLSEIDLFDQCQLEKVIQICRSSRSLAEAGKKLFAASRLQRKSRNDSDRIRKYLERFDLRFEDL